MYATLSRETIEAIQAELLKKGASFSVFPAGMSNAGRDDSSLWMFTTAGWEFSLSVNGSVFSRLVHPRKQLIHGIAQPSIMALNLTQPAAKIAQTIIRRIVRPMSDALVELQERLDREERENADECALMRRISPTAQRRDYGAAWELAEAVEARQDEDGLHLQFSGVTETEAAELVNLIKKLRRSAFPPPANLN